MIENFKISFKEFVKNPYTSLLILIGMFAFYTNSQLISEKSKQMDLKQKEYDNCRVELERRNKILEEIVFNQKLKENAE